MLGCILAPGLHLCQHRLWTLGYDLDLAEKDVASVAIDREPITFEERHAADLGAMGGFIDHQS
jgi:hypothetical protein